MSVTNDPASPTLSRSRYFGLSGAPVLVTGGATGLGTQLVRDFAAQGAKVAFLDILDEPAEALVTECSRSDSSVRYLHCDLRDAEAIASAVENAADWAGGLKVLVNNAAWDDRHALESADETYWDENVAINLRHAFFTAKAAVPHLRRSQGAIVNLGSTGWLQANGGYPIYAACKAALLGLTRGLARDLGEAGVRVNCVTPGWVMTERQQRLWATPEARAANRARQCLKQDLMPAHVSELIMFLASDAAAGCTAQNYVVDMGQT